MSAKKIHIRIVSPSGKVDTRIIDAACQRLRSWGWTVSEGRYARGQYGRFAGTPEERLADLKEAMTDPTVDYILCSRGGYGLQQIIDRVARVVSRRPQLPPVIGFSDITCLHSLYALTDTVSVHGLMGHIGDWQESCESVQAWRDVLEGKEVCYTLPAHPLQREGEVSGILIGGNLSVLYGLQGTPWSLKTICRRNERAGQKNILFLEDVGERHYHIDRMMQNLRLSGVFHEIDGLIIGQFTDCDNDPMMQQTVQETIVRATEGYSFPIVMGFPAGHDDGQNLPFRLNTGTLLQVSKTATRFFQKGYDNV